MKTDNFFNNTITCITDLLYYFKSCFHDIVLYTNRKSSFVFKFDFKTCFYRNSFTDCINWLIWQQLVYFAMKLESFSISWLVTYIRKYVKSWHFSLWGFSKFNSIDRFYLYFIFLNYDFNNYQISEFKNFFVEEKKLCAKNIW